MIEAGGRRAGEAMVAGHYDALDRFYREIWGEHVHHGLWRTGGETPEEATRALLDLALTWAAPALRPEARVVDVGCGYGGSARVLAAAHGADVVGFTLSAAQAAWAREQGGGPRYEVRSWLEHGLEDGSADVVLAIESLSHMSDVPRALAEAARVLRPGGRLVVVDWLAREQPGARETRLLLRPIAREGRLPALGTLGEYRAWAEAAGLRVLGTDDVSRQVGRTWRIVGRRLLARLARDREARRFLLSAANPDRAFALSLVRIPLALGTGALRLALLAAERPRP